MNGDAALSNPTAGAFPLGALRTRAREQAAALLAPDPAAHAPSTTQLPSTLCSKSRYRSCP